jgi:hypothetical protein
MSFLAKRRDIALTPEEWERSYAYSGCKLFPSLYKHSRTNVVKLY